MSAVNKSLKVLVKLKRTLNSFEEQTAHFGQCVVDFFGFSGSGLGHVGLNYSNDELILFGLSPSNDKQPEEQITVLLKHSSTCPVSCISPTEFETIPAEVKEKGVGVGVAILVTSNDNHVLLTRRAQHMRTFPGVWVPPGGHIEAGENILEAGLRELKEETGLTLIDTPYHILGLWESVYPHKLELGTPSRQHIVVYLSVWINLSWKELSNQLKLEPLETDAAMWLPSALVAKISTGHSQEKIPNHVYMLTPKSNGFHDELEVETEPIIKFMAPPENASQVDLERFSWGTRFALQQWVVWIENFKTSGSKL